MRIFNKYIYLTLLAFAATACFEEPGNEILFNADPELEFDVADSGSQGTYVRLNDGSTADDEIVVNLVGKQRSSAVEFTIATGDLTTAIDGIHYEFPDGLSYSIPAGESSVSIPLTVYPDELEFGEPLVLEVVIATADIKISPNNSTLIHVIDVTCPSDLAGTFSYSTTNVNGGGSGGNEASCQSLTGNGTLTQITPGVYSMPDASFGVYACVWGDAAPSAVRFVELCGNVSLTGTDQYGDSFSIDITNVTDTQLTFNWSNGFGDSGTTVLTRTDTKEWPPLTTD